MVMYLFRIQSSIFVSVHSAVGGYGFVIYPLLRQFVGCLPFAQQFIGELTYKRANKTS